MVTTFRVSILLVILVVIITFASDLYKETYRPQFHFTARQWSYNLLNPGMQQEGWINDVCGLVYLDGTYHLFAQRWCRAWLHAVSTDLVHWEELEPAFWADEAWGCGVQSGTCVIDSNNTSGLATGTTPVMVAFWEGQDNTAQCISYSNDKGITWIKYENNPVLRHGERDPKVFWYAPGNKWIMVLYYNGGYTFFSSTNLLSWQEMSSNPNYYECPDFFELPIDGNQNNKKWILMNGDGSYDIGTFDGTTFTPQTSRRPLDHGANFYATGSFNNIPEADGRRIHLAWMRSDGSQIYPDMPFNQQWSFPCDLTLHNYADTLRLFSLPIREIEQLHQSGDRLVNQTLSAGASFTLADNSVPLHIVAQLTLSDSSSGAVLVHGRTVQFSNTALAIDNNSANFAVRLNKLKLELLIDRTSIEAFGNNGEIAISNCYRETNNQVQIMRTAGSVTIDTLITYPLASIWPDSVEQGFKTNLTGTWTAINGTWKDSATGKIGSGAGDIFCLNSQEGDDFTYEGDVEALTGPAAALVFRANADASQGYCINVDNAGLLKLWAPGRGELTRFDNRIINMQVYHLKVITKGANIKVYFNHRVAPVIDYTDANPVLRGQFGLNVYSGTGNFQNVLVNNGETLIRNQQSMQNRPLRMKIGPVHRGNPIRIQFEGMENLTGKISLQVFDLQGRSVKTFLFDRPTSEMQSIDFALKNDRGKVLPCGQYFCRLTTGTKEMGISIVERLAVMP